MSEAPEIPAPAPNGLPIPQDATIIAFLEGIIHGSTTHQQTADRLAQAYPGVSVMIELCAERAEQDYGEAAAEFFRHMGYGIVGVFDQQASADVLMQELPSLRED